MKDQVELLEDEIEDLKLEIQELRRALVEDIVTATDFIQRRYNGNKARAIRLFKITRNTLNTTLPHGIVINQQLYKRVSK